MHRPGVLSREALEYFRFDLSNFEKSSSRSRGGLLPLFPSTHGRRGHAQHRGEDGLAYTEALFPKLNDLLFRLGLCEVWDIHCRGSQLSGSARVRSGFLKPCNKKLLSQFGLAHVYLTSFFTDRRG